MYDWDCTLHSDPACRVQQGVRVTLCLVVCASQEMFTLKFIDFTVVYISQLSIRAPCILTVDCNRCIVSLVSLRRLDVFAAEDGMMGVTRQLTTQSQCCDYGAANAEGGRRNGLEDGDGGGCHSSKLPACSLDVRWQSDKVRGWIVSDFGAVDAAGSSTTKRC